LIGRGGFGNFAVPEMICRPGSSERSALGVHIRQCPRTDAVRPGPCGSRLERRWRPACQLQYKPAGIIADRFQPGILQQALQGFGRRVIAFQLTALPPGCQLGAKRNQYSCFTSKPGNRPRQRTGGNMVMTTHFGPGRFHRQCLQWQQWPAQGDDQQ